MGRDNYCLERTVYSKCHQYIYDIFMVFIREILKVPSDPVHSMILLNQTNLSFNFIYKNENSSEAKESSQYTHHTTIICLIVKQPQRT